MKRSLTAILFWTSALIAVPGAESVAEEVSQAKPAPGALPPIPSKRLPEAVPPEPAPSQAPAAATSSEPPAAAASAPRQPAVPAATPAPAPVAAPRGPELELLFTYGSEKQKWIEAAVARFNASAQTLPGGDRVRVVPMAVGSGELIDEVLTERRRPHVVSPAAGAFITIGNAASREKGQGDLVGPTEDLARSPIVVMIWREMAEAIGWPKKAIRWRDVFEYAREPSKWREASRAKWGAFKFAHTHPDSSNSGLHALILEAYAGADKFSDLSRTDVKNNPEIERYLRQVENAIPYYESSTGVLARRMLREGKSGLSAAIVYENLVIEANQDLREKGPATKTPAVVAIYPVEGTFPSEHPVGIVERPWVTERHREAARRLIAYLRAKPQQEEAKRYGFRPADPSISLDDLLKPELGVNAAEPKRMLTPPSSAAISQLRDLWHRSRDSTAAAHQGR